MEKKIENGLFTEGISGVTYENSNYERKQEAERNM